MNIAVVVVDVDVGVGGGGRLCCVGADMSTTSCGNKSSSLLVSQKVETSSRLGYFPVLCPSFRHQQSRADNIS